MAMVAWTAASAVTAGASLLYNIAGAPDFSIVCTVVIENRTRYPLHNPGSYLNSGEMRSPPVAVRPRHKESFIAHKVSNAMAGSAGTASWYIKGLDKKVAVMWSCPYYRTICNNWLGVGLIDPDDGPTGADLYTAMFEGEDHDNPDLEFVRGKYNESMATLCIDDGTIKITGIMGTSEKPTVHITVEALDENN